MAQVKCQNKPKTNVCVQNVVYLKGSPIVGAADNPFVVKANAAHQFLMTFQHSQTCPTLYVP